MSDLFKNRVNFASPDALNLPTFNFRTSGGSSFGVRGGIQPGSVNNPLFTGNVTLAPEIQNLRNEALRNIRGIRTSVAADQARLRDTGVDDLVRPLVRSQQRAFGSLQRNLSRRGLTGPLAQR